MVNYGFTFSLERTLHDYTFHRANKGMIIYIEYKKEK